MVAQLIGSHQTWKETTTAEVMATFPSKNGLTKDVDARFFLSTAKAAQQSSTTKSWGMILCSFVSPAFLILQAFPVGLKQPDPVLTVVWTPSGRQVRTGDG